jgi:hypothetical protein
LLVQNRINRPFKPPIHTNQTHKNQTFKKDRILLLFQLHVGIDGTFGTQPIAHLYLYM